MTGKIKLTIMETNDARLTLCEARGPLSDILEKLAGKQGRYWLTALKITLRKENAFHSEPFVVWGEVELGNFESVEIFVKKLEEKNYYDSYKIEDRVINFLRNSIVVPTNARQKIKLVAVSAWELGLKNDTSYSEIVDRADWLGLKLCPQEIGLQLCLQHQSRKFRDLFIATEAIDDGHNDGPVIIWATNNFSIPDITTFVPGEYCFPLNWKFLFCLP